MATGHSHEERLNPWGSAAPLHLLFPVCPMFTPQTIYSIVRALITKRSPYYIQFYINGRCNLMCRQCNIVETNSRIPEMDLQQIRLVARNLRLIGAGIVLLTGGEPFLRRDLPDIVAAFTAEKMNVRLQTAGTKASTPEMLQACYDAGARDINVSLDSLDLNTFDYINGVPGSAENAIRSIELISSIFRRDSSILSFGTVLSRLNYREIPAIVEFAERIGWFVSLVPVHIAAQDARFGFRSYESLFSFPPEMRGQLEHLGKELIILKQKHRALFDSIRFLESAIEFLKGSPPTWRNANSGRCDSPNLYFAIRPNGDFTTCCDYTLKEAPKVYESGFVDSYLSGKIKQREDVMKIVESCSGCHYGSYPEVSITVRDWRAFVERAALVSLRGRGRLARAPVKENFPAEIARIKNRHPFVYPTTNWLQPELSKVLTTWGNPAERQEILRSDMAKRRQERRIRGEGSDIPIQAIASRSDGSATS